jgi:molybdate transport system regulatory protein
MPTTGCFRRASLSESVGLRRAGNLAIAKLRHPDRLGLHLRVVLRGGVVMGPGRAELLEAIRQHGSISAAGRALDMSYKRAWDLIEALNASFREPLVEAARGGASGGGAQLTRTGETVLELYRRVEAAASASAAAELALLDGLLATKK